MKPPGSLALATPRGGSCSGPAEPDPRKGLVARWRLALNHGVQRRAVLGLLLAALIAPHVQAQDTKVLRVARTYQFDTLDPPRMLDLGSADMVALLYSSLLRFAYLERPYKVEPDLLERMPDLSADQLTYTLRLRKGVRFHDDACFPGGQGRELTADDVLYSLRRFADARVNIKGWHTLEGQVQGLDAFRAATAKPGSKVDAGADFPVEGLKKLDSHTLTLRLVRPNPQFLNALALVNTAIVPAEAVKAYGDRFAARPVGTGPFTLKEVDRKGVLRFTRYTRYHGTYPTVGAPGDAERGLLKDAGRKLPFVDVLELPLIEEAQPRMLRFLNGELDWTGLDRANFTRMAQRGPDGNLRLQPEFAARMQLYSSPGNDLYYLTLNMKDPLLGRNKALRQALAHLVDTQAEIDVLRNGRGRKLGSLIPLGMPGNERDTGASLPGYDLARARQLLAEAGYPGGKGLPVLTVHYPDTSTEGRNSFDLLRAKAAAGGVQLKAFFSDWPTFLKAAESGNFQIAVSGWQAGSPNAAEIYQILHGRNVPPGPNFGGFVNAAYDSAYEASRWMADGPARIAHFRRMNEIVRDEVPLIVQYESIVAGVAHPWVRNFKRNPVVPEFMYVDIDPALQRAARRP